MARIFTVEELVSMAKERSDQEGASFVSDGEWRSYLSAGYAVLHSKLVDSGMRYFEDEELFTVDGSKWTLPEEFLTTIGVDRLLDGTSTGRRYQLEENMAQERNMFSGASSNGSAVRYAIIGQTLTLYPTPPTSEVYAHVYIPQPAKLTSDTAKVDVVSPDGEQYLLWYATFLARDKEDTDTRSALRERSEALDRLTEWAAKRAFLTPRRPVQQQDLGGGGLDYDPGGYRWNSGGR